MIYVTIVVHVISDFIQNKTITGKTLMTNIISEKKKNDQNTAENYVISSVSGSWHAICLSHARKSDVKLMILLWQKEK